MVQIYSPQQKVTPSNSFESDDIAPSEIPESRPSVSDQISTDAEFSKKCAICLNNYGGLRLQTGGKAINLF